MQALPLIFASATFILYIAALILLLMYLRKRSRCGQCMGTIVRFTHETARYPRNSHGSRQITPVVDYMVDGRMYEILGNYYATTMRVGKPVKVFYDLDDPSKATTGGGTLVAALITGGLAVFFTIFTVALFLMRPFYA